MLWCGLSIGKTLNLNDIEINNRHGKEIGQHAVQLPELRLSIAQMARPLPGLQPVGQLRRRGGGGRRAELEDRLPESSGEVVDAGRSSRWLGHLVTSGFGSRGGCLTA